MAQSNATQSFVCALTGQSPLTDAVVTPSGYVCSRKLLLTKLAENGGVDPFDSSGTRRLDESALVELNVGGAGSAGAAAPPRPPKATSLPSLLGMLQNEFDAVLLELYDTRKALEETRRELSSALYQNDAAVRVVARVVKERDDARARLEEFLSGDAAAQREAAAAAAGAPAGEPQKRGRDDEEAGADAPAKKSKTDEEDESDITKIPSSDLAAMSATWKTLTKGRKSIAKLKRTPAQTAENEKTLTELAEGSEKKVNLGKSSAKAGVLCMTSIKSGDVEYIVKGGHDKTAIVYSVNDGKMVGTLSGAGGDVTTVHGMAADEKTLLVVTGSVDGFARLYTVPLNGYLPALLGSAELSKGTPISVTVHPSSTAEEARVLVGSSDGMIELYKNTGGEELKLATRLESAEEGTKYTSGCMHPDGFIYIAGTAAGELIVWDLKTQAVAGTLKGHDGKSIDCIAISENGYHVASSSPSSDVHIWDLRKLKLASTVSPGDDVGAVHSVAFDPTATYLAYAGDGATKVCVAKDWERVVCTFNPYKGKGGKKNKKYGGVVGGVSWGGQGFGVKEGEGGKVWLAMGCDGERPVRIWGVE